MFEGLYNLEPVAFSVAGYSIYWYGIAYITALLAGKWYLEKLIPHVNALMNYAVIGIIAGGKLGNWLLYTEGHLYSRGGMSFHGGLVGLAIAAYMFCKKYNVLAGELAEHITKIAPLGLMLGRLANAINNEIPGRVTDNIFAVQQDVLRHPVSVYQSIAEGPVLWLIMRSVKRNHFSVFVQAYSILRFLTEHFKADTVYATSWLWLLIYGCMSTAIKNIIINRLKSNGKMVETGAQVEVACYYLTLLLPGLYFLKNGALSLGQIYSLAMLITAQSWQLFHKPKTA